jgi:hypothetical protein
MLAMHFANAAHTVDVLQLAVDHLTRATETWF